MSIMVERYLEKLDAESVDVLIDIGIQRAVEATGFTFDSPHTFRKTTAAELASAIKSARFRQIYELMNWDEIRANATNEFEYEQNVIYQAEMVATKIIHEDPPQLDECIPF